MQTARAEELIKTCRECGMNAPEPGPWIHCRGSTRAWRNFRREPHHGRLRWTCSRCGGHLGCDICAGARAQDVLCLKCRTFANGDVVFGSGLEPIDPAAAIPVSEKHHEAEPIPRALAGIERSLPRGDWG